MLNFLKASQKLKTNQQNLCFKLCFILLEHLVPLVKKWIIVDNQKRLAQYLDCIEVLYTFQTINCTRKNVFFGFMLCSAALIH